MRIQQLKYQSELHTLRFTYEEFKNMNKNINNSILNNYLILNMIQSQGFISIYDGFNPQSQKKVRIQLYDLEMFQNQQNLTIRENNKNKCQIYYKFLMLCNSCHISKCYDTYQNESITILITQYCNEGTLQSQIKKRKTIQQKEAIIILGHIVNGLAQIHKKGIIHGNLTPSNISSNNGVYKITKLGFCQQVNQYHSQELILNQHQYSTIALEFLNGQSNDFKTDIWSIGIIFYQMLFGVKPIFSTIQNQRQIQLQILQTFASWESVNDKVSLLALDFLKKSMQMDINKRMSWQQLINHQILKMRPQLLNNFIIPTVISQKPSWNYKFILQENVLESSHTVLNRNKIIKFPINKINYQEHQPSHLQKVKAAHLQCLKSNFLFISLFCPLRERNLLKLKRINIQFFNLLLFRCLVNMNPIKDFNHQHDENFIYLSKMAKILYERILYKCQYYNQFLTRQQNKIFSIIKDSIFKRINPKQRIQKDRYFTGIEGTDFQKEQQIQYTVTNYISQISSQVCKKQNYIHSILKNYKKICNITLEEMKDQNFQNYVRKILIGQKQPTKNH